MSEHRRRAAATATVGYGGVAGAAMLRHQALNSAYHGGKRPDFFAERRLIKRPRGRARYLAGAGLALLTAPAAVKGTNDLLEKRQSFITEGMQGASDAWRDKRDRLRHRAPVKLMASNYATGAGITLAAGGATQLALHRKKLPGGVKGAVASVAGTAAGAASLPIQRKRIERKSRGRYTLTANGLERKEVTKADPGANMTRRQRRAMVTASGGLPIVGDFTQSAQAARLSPKPLRTRSALEQYAGNQAGSVVGGAAGAGGALALAHASEKFNHHAQRASDKVDQAEARVRRAAHMPAKARRAGRVARALERTGPGRAVARNPKVAAIGALAGSHLGSQIGAQLTYGRIMTRDDRYRRANPAASHGSRIAKRTDQVTGMSRKDELRAIKRKRRTATINAATSVGGVVSLGMLGAAALPGMKHRGALVRGASTVGTASAGVGAVNGLESAHLARRDLKAREKVLTSKAFGLPRVPRTPGMRRGFLRQTRTATGLKVSSVRGGLIR